MIKQYKTTIKQQSESKWQNHLEIEVIFVFKGKGEFYSDSENLEFEIINAGDIKILPPFKSHLIKNNSKENIEIIGLYWNESPNYSPKQQNKKLINLILPSFTTPNGRMHLGHIGGPVLIADIFKRSQTALGFDSTFQLTGSIGFQTHTGVTAQKLGLSYFDTAIKFSDDFVRNYKMLEIDFDEFVTLKDFELYQYEVLEFIKFLTTLPNVTTKEKDAPFCESCNMFIFEANVIGNCPHCNSVISGECETCAVYVPDDKIVKPKCRVCEREATFKPLRRSFINLEVYRTKIKSLLIRGVYRGNSANDVEHFLKSPLPEIPLSIYADEGILVPQLDGQRVYSAIELVPRFLTALNKLSQKVRFSDDSEYRLNLFFGKDNSYLRCIIFPLLLGIYKPKIICDLFFSNEFWLLNGEKFSTSRSNVLYAEDIIHEIGSDWIRFLLTLDDISITECDFNKELYKDKLKFYKLKTNDILDKINVKVKDDFACTIPESGIWEKRHIYFYEFLESAVKLATRAFDKDAYNPSKINALGREVLEELYNFSFLLDLKYANNNVYRTVMALNLLGLKSLALLFFPIMPNFSKNILGCLGENNISLNLKFPNPGTLINKIEL